MKIEFDATEYQFSHGKRPSGYGSWAFFFDRSRDPDKAFFVQPACSYAVAKSIARDEAKRREVSVVYVGP